MAETFVVTINQRTFTVALEDLAGGTLRAVVDGHERLIDARPVTDGTWSLVEGTEARLVDVDGALGKLMIEVSHPDGDPRQATASVTDVAAEARRLRGSARPASSGATTLRAPIPGKLVKVAIKVGEHVKAGQTLRVLEAMKMENEIRAPHDAAIVAVHVTEGTTVEAGFDLVSLA